MSLDNLINASNKWMLCDSEINIYLLEEDISSLEKSNLGVSNFWIYWYISLGLLKIVLLFFKQFIKSNLSPNDSYDHLVAETQAAHHHQNYFEHFNRDRSSNYTVFKCFDSDEYTSLLKG